MIAGHGAKGWPVARAHPLLKMCGLTRPDLAEAAVAAGADMVGIVSFPKSPRHVGIADAAAIARSVEAAALVVALVVDPSDEEIDTLHRDVRPGAWQFHGRETPERVAAIASRTGLPVMKAFGVASRSDLTAADDFDALALFDAKPPPGASRPGGLGHRFDWNVLSEVEGRRFVLSGGLDAQNVAEAVTTVRPYAIDVSSGIEVDGVKDVGLMGAFAKAMREAADRTF